jgi:hypothetical protein
MNNSPPPAPDPYKTASAQGASNVQTGIANSVMNNPNRSGPMGDVKYSESGEKQTITLPDGTTAQVPRYTETTTLSPEQQGLYNQQTQLGGKMNNLALSQVDRLDSSLGKPLDLSGIGVDPNSFSADRTRVEDAMRQRLSGQNTQDYNQLESKLTNQGFQRGTEGFNNAMDEYRRGINDQNLAITERGLAEQQGLYGMADNAAKFKRENMLTERNQPLNEISALMSGGQVSMPQTPNYNPGQVAGTDVSGNVYNSAALAQQNYQAKLAQQNAMIGGLAGIGGMGMYGLAKKWGG